MAKKTDTTIPIPSNPTTAAEFITVGYAKKTSGSLDDAAVSFEKAIALDPDSYEAYYGLGLVQKAQDRRQDSIQSFEKVLGLLSDESIDVARSHMLQRLVKAHINQLRSGDWDLEKEIWQHK